jgi:hypothetical protein
MRPGAMNAIKLTTTINALKILKCIQVRTIHAHVSLEKPPFPLMNDYAGHATPMLRLIAGAKRR